jgi:peptidoglycan-associated lipoprotein
MPAFFPQGVRGLNAHLSPTRNFLVENFDGGRLGGTTDLEVTKRRQQATNGTARRLEESGRAMKSHIPFAISAFTLAAPAFFSCAQAKPQIKAPAPVVAVQDNEPVRKQIFPDILDDNPIYFGFNDQLLDESSLARLMAIASYMEGQRDTEVTITGHADERGTFEYNLALGDRRARAARDYLVRLGIASNRVFVVSYGEEAPAAEGTSDDDEDAHALNRRDEFMFFTRLTRTAAR